MMVSRVSPVRELLFFFFFFFFWFAMFSLLPRWIHITWRSGGFNKYDCLGLVSRLALNWWLTESCGGREAATLCSSYLPDNRLHDNPQSTRQYIVQGSPLSATAAGTLIRKQQQQQLVRQTSLSEPPWRWLSVHPKGRGVSCRHVFLDLVEIRLQSCLCGHWIKKSRLSKFVKSFLRESAGDWKRGSAGRLFHLQHCVCADRATHGVFCLVPWPGFRNGWNK